MTSGAWEQWNFISFEVTSRFVVLSVHTGQGGGQRKWSDEGGVMGTSRVGGGLSIDVHLGSGGANSRM